MALKIKQSSTLTMELPVVDGFVVCVRRLGPLQIKQLSDRCSRPRLNRATGTMEQVIEDDLWNKHAPDAYLDPAGCRGLTPSVIQQLGIELSEDPEVDGNGEVPVTRDILRDLWTHADGNKFSLPVIRLSREMLSIAELEKKSGSTDSADLSVS